MSLKPAMPVVEVPAPRQADMADPVHLVATSAAGHVVALYCSEMDGRHSRTLSGVRFRVWFDDRVLCVEARPVRADGSHPAPLTDADIRAMPLAERSKDALLCVAGSVAVALQLRITPTLEYFASLADPVTDAALNDARLLLAESNARSLAVCDRLDADSALRGVVYRAHALLRYQRRALNAVKAAMWERLPWSTVARDWDSCDVTITADELHPLLAETVR